MMMEASLGEGREAQPLQFSRYEIKVPLQRFQFFEFERYVRCGGLFPRETFPPRQVHSVYLDTSSFEDYHDNVSGISARKKTRIRWYDDKPEKMALEFKVKRNKISSKHVIGLSNEHGIVPIDRAALSSLLNQNRDHAETRELGCLFPVLKVVYDRRYLILANEVRMTIDREMRFRRLYPIPTGPLHRSPVDVVIELKFPVDNAREAKRMLSSIPFRIFRHSKYVIGMDLSCG